jgi:hypothetical protein
MKRLGRISLVRISMMTLGVIALTLVLGIASSKQVRAAVSALVQVSNPVSSPVYTQEVADKNAFQLNLHLGFAEQAIAIPAGQRLVVDFVAINGDADSLQGAIQPSVVFISSINGGPGVNYYLQPQASSTLPDQFHISEPVKIYADTLSISTAYSGYSPNNFNFNISISGHLVPIP